MHRPRQPRRARTRVRIPSCCIRSLALHLLLESGTGGGTGTGGTASSRRKDGRGTKRGRDEDDTNRRPDMKLNVPEILKVLLVDDWEAVTKNNQVRPFSTLKVANIQILLSLSWLPFRGAPPLPKFFTIFKNSFFRKTTQSTWIV